MLKSGGPFRHTLPCLLVSATMFLLAGVAISDEAIAATSPVGDREKPHVDSTAPIGTSGQPGKPPQETPFPMMGQDMFFAKVRSSGRTLVAGFYVQWDAEVKRLQHATTPDKVVVDLCYGSPYNAIRTFIPVADQFVMSPFVDLCDEGPQTGDKIWPTLDHPLVNRLRKIRTLAPDKRIYATIAITNSRGTLPAGVADHATSLAEAQWIICALVGSGWDGILTFDFDQASQYASDILRIEEALRQHAADLASASPVDWVRDSTGQPISSLCSDDRLFVVLLDPTCYALDHNGNCTVPLKALTPRKGQIIITPPHGLDVRSGRTLLGKPLELAHAGDIISSLYEFEGGGDILVFDLAGGAR
jgi:hypothetical protein